MDAWAFDAIGTRWQIDSRRRSTPRPEPRSSRLASRTSTAPGRGSAPTRSCADIARTPGVRTVPGAESLLGLLRRAGRRHRRRRQPLDRADALRPRATTPTTRCGRRPIRRRFGAVVGGRASRPDHHHDRPGADRRRRGRQGSSRRPGRRTAPAGRHPRGHTVDAAATSTTAVPRRSGSRWSIPVIRRGPSGSSSSTPGSHCAAPRPTAAVGRRAAPRASTAAPGDPTVDVVATWVWSRQSCMIADGLATAHFFAEPDRLLERWDHQFVRMHADGRVVWSPDLPGEVFA